jgi:hypothetical protein
MLQIDWDLVGRQHALTVIEQMRTKIDKALCSTAVTASSVHIYFDGVRCNAVPYNTAQLSNYRAAQLQLCPLIPASALSCCNCRLRARAASV